jgi:long-chain acyl-CoA synthetase
VYGDGKKYLVAGVWLEEAAVKAHFAAQHAEDTPEARRALVQRRIERVGASLASFETIKNFAIVGEPLTVEGGLLTPTLKVKRKAVYERFRDVFEGLYA